MNINQNEDSMELLAIKSFTRLVFNGNIFYELLGQAMLKKENSLRWKSAIEKIHSKLQDGDELMCILQCGPVSFRSSRIILKITKNRLNIAFFLP